jgi:hypothetical protein
MTEAEWLEADDSWALLRFLKDEVFFGRQLSTRKQRLFACACVRLIWGLLDDERSRRAVEVAERYADRAAKKTDLSLAQREAWEACGAILMTHAPHRHAAAIAAARVADGSSSFKNGDLVSRYVLMATGAPPPYVCRERALQADLFRCVFGSPFRYVALAPACRTPAILSLAGAAYDDRLLPSGELDAARLNVLADALEEAVCGEADLLGHLRSPGPHVRGCWALDLVLGKA